MEENNGEKVGQKLAVADGVMVRVFLFVGLKRRSMQ